MPRSTSIALLVAFAAATGAVAESLVWPAPPAEPVVRFESEVRKLADFEVAIQGPTQGNRRIQKLKRPSGVAFDGRGRLLVSDSRQGTLMMIDPDLGVVLVYGTGTTPSLRQPMGIAVGGDGTIFVADAGLRGVVAFHPNGEVEAVYGDELMQEPNDLALSPDGKSLYVVDTAADSIAVFDLESERRLETFGRTGAGVAEFRSPTAAEFDADGRLFVVDQLNTRVQVFDSERRFTRALQRPDDHRIARPSDIAVDDAGRIFVTDVAQSHVVVYGVGMDPIVEFGRNGLRHGEFLAVGSVAAFGDTLAVLDRAGGRILLFDLPGVERRPATEPVVASDRSADEAPLEATRLAEPPTEVVAPADTPPVAEPEPVAEPPSDTGPEIAETVDPPVEPKGEERADDAQLMELARAWAAAWAAQDADTYLSFYDDSFVPGDGSSRADWSRQRRERVTAPTSIEVELEALEVEALGPASAEVTFVQSYRSERFSDRVRKALRFHRSADTWKIVLETVLETLASP